MRKTTFRYSTALVSFRNPWASNLIVQQNSWGLGITGCWAPSQNFSFSWSGAEPEHLHVKESSRWHCYVWFRDRSLRTTDAKQVKTNTSVSFPYLICICSTFVSQAKSHSRLWIIAKISWLPTLSLSVQSLIFSHQYLYVCPVIRLLYVKTFWDRLVSLENKWFWTSGLSICKCAL